MLFYKPFVASWFEFIDLKVAKIEKETNDHVIHHFMSNAHAHFENKVRQHIQNFPHCLQAGFDTTNYYIK